MGELGKILVFCGAALVLIGGLLLILGKIPGMGKLPGDIVVRKGNFTFYFPLATCLIISLLLTFIVQLWNRK